MQPHNEIDQFAEELRDKYIECFRKQAPTDFVWVDLANHVTKLILRARIDAHGHYLGYDRWVTNRTLYRDASNFINELTTKLSELEKER